MSTQREKTAVKAPATDTLIILCLALTILIHVLPFDGNDTEKAVLLGAYYKPFILAGEWWRVVSAGLIHISWWHLAMNMFSLHALGTAMERLYGTKRYLLLLFGSSAAGYLFYFIQDSNTVTVGLSGGLYGLLAAYIFIVYRAGGWKNPDVRMSMIEMIVINLAINFMPNVAWMVHVGGFLGGMLLSILLLKDPFLKTARRNAAAAVAIFCVFLGYGASKENSIPENEVYLRTDASILTYEYNHGLESHAQKTAQKLDTLYGTNGYLEYTITGGA